MVRCWCVSGLLDPFVWKIASLVEVSGQAVLLIHFYMFFFAVHMAGCSFAGFSLSGRHLSLDTYSLATFKTLPNLYKDLKEKKLIWCA